MDPSTACPRCAATGHRVNPETPAALLTTSAQQRLSGVPLRFCPNESCEVVYYGDASPHVVLSDEVRVPVFQKHDDPDRLVCYCFEHRVSEIEADVERTGDSSIPAAITEQCRAGLDDCARKNPQGRCCLGNVRRIVRAAQAARASHESAPDSASAPLADDCCSTEACIPSAGHASASRRLDKAGLLSSAGAVFAAILASACCWLPLTLVALGASTAGVSGVFEAYRPHLLAITAVLLGTGFYFVYVRKPKCAPGEACAVPDPRVTRFNKITLWIATGLVVTFASFPSYVGALFGGIGDGSTERAATDSATVTHSYAIEGMTCEACASHIRGAVLDVPGVKAAEVNFPAGTATVVFEGDRADDAAVLRAVEGAGYSGRPLTR